MGSLRQINQIYEEVAFGTTLQAAILNNNVDAAEMIVLDVNLVSIGIEKMSSLITKLIPKNSSQEIAQIIEKNFQQKISSTMDSLSKNLSWKDSVEIVKGNKKIIFQLN